MMDTASQPSATLPRLASGRVPITLLTGFLGSGKTTLLNRAMRHPDLAHALVIVNEFGAVGLDHVLVEASNDQIVVLENGCMCCTVRGDLLETLNTVYQRRRQGELPAFDQVLIESSGLADPKPVLQCLLSEPALEGHYRLAQVISTFDVINGAGTLARHEAAVRQIALADQVLLTKLDLLEPEQAARCGAEQQQLLRTLNPAATIAPAPRAEHEAVRLVRHLGADPACGAEQALRWLNAETYLAAACAAADAGHTHAHHLDEIASFCFIKQEPIARDALHLLLASLESNLSENLLRVKGLVNIAEEPDRPALVQGAQHLLHNLSWLPAWPTADRRTRIVFIAQGIARRAVEEMIELLERVASRSARARLGARAAAPAALQ